MGMKRGSYVSIFYNISTITGVILGLAEGELPRTQGAASSIIETAASCIGPYLRQHPLTSGSSGPRSKSAPKQAPTSSHADPIDRHGSVWTMTGPAEASTISASIGVRCCLAQAMPSRFDSCALS